MKLYVGKPTDHEKILRHIRKTIKHFANRSGLNENAVWELFRNGYVFRDTIYGPRWEKRF